MLTADRIAVIDLDKEYADRGPDWFMVRFASSELAAVAATGTVEEMGPMSLSLPDSSSLAAGATVAATSARQCPTCGHVLTEAAAEPSTSLLASLQPLTLSGQKTFSPPAPSWVGFNIALITVF
jgi:hypothetical protein